MRQLMEYKIISGNVVETRRSYLSARDTTQPPKGRAKKVAGHTSARKIAANEQECVRQFARILNTNYHTGDLHLVLKYDDDHLPPDYQAAEADLARYFARLRYEIRKAGLVMPVISWVTANWSPRRDCPARLHHHVVVPAGSYDLARRLWLGGGFSLETLDGRGDHTDLAAYMIANVRDRPGKHSWHTTRNATRPIVTEPEPVADIEDVQPEKGAVIKAHETSTDEEGRVTSTYLRCLLPYRPYVRGGKICKPSAKRGGHKTGGGTA